MQFGRISGIALMVLGALLFAFQATAFLSSPSVNPAPSAQEQSHKTTSLPAIVGAVSVILDVALFATARRRDEPDPRHAVK